ncbi:MAG: PIG-L family deacetylase [Caldilineaceae bacterium]|nr:PIG-L family deacetylase [Caldilineaceae bacterium]
MNNRPTYHNGSQPDGRRLLCILAHPDDESLGFGGLLAHYAHVGVATYLISATRGERGWPADPATYPGPTALGHMRTEELQAAATILGIKETQFLDVMDGDLDQADPVAMIGTLVGHLRRVRPQVVATFDPTGIYGHPDHIAISQLATAAVNVAANPNYIDGDEQAPHQVSKLYYRAWCAAESAIYQQVFGDLVMNIDGVERRATNWPEWAFTTQIDTTAYWQQVQRAVDCHRSQLPAYRHFATLPTAQQRILWGNQTFYRAMSLVNGGREIEDDLFAGIPAEPDAHPIFSAKSITKLPVSALFATKEIALN